MIRRAIQLALPAALMVSSAPGAVTENASPGWIVFSSARSGDGDLYRLDLVAAEPELLVSSAFGEGGARYDAFRRRLIHVRYEDDRALLMAGDEVLFPDPSGDVPPVWSPDGRWIAFASRRDGREDLYLARADGSGVTAVTTDDEPDRYPAWSPDSRRLVFARQLESGWDLHTITVDEKSPRVHRLTEEGAYVGHPDWSPDGRSIAFDTQVDDQTEIAILDLETRSIRRLTDRPGNDLVPAWSLDGTHLAFGADSGDGNWELWSVTVTTGDLRRLTDSPGFDGGPVFVPSSVASR